MSLSAWEQDALDSIKSGLADSDPALVAAALASSRGDGPRSCAGSFVTLCGGATAAPQPAQPIP